MWYVHFYLIFLKENKLQFITKASSVACGQVISNLSLNILYKIKPTVFMHGTGLLLLVVISIAHETGSQRLATFCLVWNNRRVLEEITMLPSTASL